MSLSLGKRAYIIQTNWAVNVAIFILPVFVLRGLEAVNYVLRRSPMPRFIYAEPHKI